MSWTGCGSERGTRVPLRSTPAGDWSMERKLSSARVPCIRALLSRKQTCKTSLTTFLSDLGCPEIRAVPCLPSQWPERMLSPTRADCAFFPPEIGGERRDGE